MIAFKYTKTDGAEYLSHLDLLRHIFRTLRRAQIPVNYSEGYHKHPKIFLNNPLPTGIKSVAEYGAIDTPFSGDFINIYNGFSPKGIKCLAFKTVDKNPDFANAVESCAYFARGVAVDCDDLLSRREIVICDLRGRTVDIRPRIISVGKEENGASFRLKSGAENLRADLFCSYLDKTYGGKCAEIIKVAAFGNPVF